MGKNCLHHILLLTGFIIISHLTMAQGNNSVTLTIFDELSLPGSGQIEIYQPPMLPVLLNKSTRINQKKGVYGFRIQIYNNTGNDARDKVIKMSEEFIQKFPEINPNVVYHEYEAPYFKLRVGDYRTRNEAFEMYNKIKKQYPNSYIVKSRINYPELYAGPDSVYNN